MKINYIDKLMKCSLSWPKKVLGVLKHNVNVSYRNYFSKQVKNI